MLLTEMSNNKDCGLFKIIEVFPVAFLHLNKILLYAAEVLLYLVIVEPI